FLYILYYLLTKLSTPKYTLFPYTTLFRSEVYLNSDDQPAFWYTDKKRQKIGWIDADGKKNIDIGGKVVLRKLISNLQNGYLKGVDRKSTRLNSSHEWISYAVFCLKKKRIE